MIGRRHAASMTGPHIQQGSASRRCGAARTFAKRKAGVYDVSARRAGPMDRSRVGPPWADALLRIIADIVASAVRPLRRRRQGSAVMGRRSCLPRPEPSALRACLRRLITAS